MMRYLAACNGAVETIVAADFHDAPAASALQRDRVSLEPLAGIGHS